jgi:diguanylate cyclase (GGDEF)-like protein
MMRDAPDPGIRHRHRGCASAWTLACAIGLAGWAQAQAPTEAEVRALLARVEAEVEIDPKRALATARSASALARRSGDLALLREAQVEACDALALVDVPAAIAEAERGLGVARKAGDFKSAAGFHSCRGYALDLHGKPAEAALEYEAAVDAAERAESKSALADALAMRGESRHYHGRYDDAIADLNRAHALTVELGLRSGQRYSLNAIANVYSDENVGEYDKAIAYYRQLLKQDQAAGFRRGEATAHFNIAAALEMKHELDAALVEYRRAMEIDTELHNTAAVAESERSIGALLTKQGKAGEALPWIDRAMARFVESGDDESIARCRLTRARALLAAGRQREAAADLSVAERHFRANANPRYLAKVYETLAEVHAASGEWRQAYEASMAYRAAQTQLDRRAREEQTSRLRVQFDTAKKEQENRALLIENAHRGEALRNAERVRSLQRLAILMGAALLALLAAMALQQVSRGRRLKRLAMTDELTGLPNRRGILDFLDRALRDARAAGAPLTVVAFDVDHFKRVNDMHGHHGGDRALRAIAGIVLRGLPPDARVGRMGGEEFLAVLPGMDDAPAHALAERLREAVSGAGFEGFAPGDRVTISLGLAGAGPGEDVEALLRRADGALYRAKREGRDRTVAG